MPRLTIELLGGLNLKLDEQPVSGFKSRKAEALLALLVCQQRAYPREELAQLFWDGSEPRQALANLRKLLTDLRKHVGDFLVVDRQTISFNFESDYWLDTAEFRELVAQGERETAVSLYKEDFLAGFYLRDSRYFDEWASLERERLRLTAIQTLEQLVHDCLHRRRYAAGVIHANRLLALDPLNEASHRLLMRLLARRGQRSQALAQYAACERILSQELGVPPLPETTAVYQRLRHAPERPFHFPSLTTRLVGRENELAQISRRLDEPDVPLVTLIGLNGVGKTRLALAAAVDRPVDYRHGVYLVRLAGYEASTPASDFLISALATALDLSFTGARPPLAQLIDFLREKEMMLLLDNFERLTDAAPLVGRLRRQAPSVQWLVTSRQPLGLPGEWVLELTGLPYPQMSVRQTAVSAPEIANYEAVQLFQQCARRVHPEFDLTDDPQHLVQVCHLVEGLPLGLELAAAATRAFSVDQIAAQLQQNLDFLASRARDLPPRHRSARAVFEQSWQLLSSAEQVRFCKLCLFRGSFTEAAAAQVAGASRPEIQQLLEKSMLRREEDGRYRIHELLRQYGQQRLQTVPDECEAAEVTYAHFYAQFLQEQARLLTGEQQKEGMNAIRTELDDIQAAWQWAVQQRHAPFFLVGTPPLYQFYSWNGRYQEGSVLFQQAINALQTVTPLNDEAQLALAQLGNRQADLVQLAARYDEALALLAQAQANAVAVDAKAELALASMVQGQIAYAQSRYDDVDAPLRAALTRFQEIGDKAGEALAWHQRARLAIRQSRYRDADSYLKKSLALNRELGHRRGIARAFNGLATVAHYWRGEFAEAEFMCRQSLVIKRELGDRHGVATDLNALGNLACDQGDLESGMAHYEECLQIRREIGAPLGIAIALNNIGTIYNARQQFAEARACYTESLTISQRIGDRLGVCFCLYNLAEVALHQSNFEEADDKWRESLQIACELDLPDRMLENLVGVALVTQQPEAPQHDPETAVRLLHYVYHHELTQPATRKRILEAAPEVADTAPARPETRPLAAVVAEWLPDPQPE